jgi:signal transduction histidine kinase
VRIPTLVAALTILVAVVISNVVLRRLAADQEANLRQLTGAYLDGLSTALLPALIRQDVWETFDTLDRARGRYRGVNARHVVVALPDGSVLAASDPQRFAVGSALPAELAARVASEEELDLDLERGIAWSTRLLHQEDSPLGAIVAEIDIADLLAVRREVLMTLVALNGALALIFAAAGYFAVRRMVRPIEVLTDYVGRARDGQPAVIPEQHLRDQSTEFGRLFASFNEMASAVREREALAQRLAEEEKAAVLGKLASGMAHEVNNPLGGMLNVVDTLRKHGDDVGVRRRGLDLLERGLSGIRAVVRTTLVSYKGPTGSDTLARGDLDDLPILLRHEMDRRRIRLEWENALPEAIQVDGDAVRQICLNLLLNACAVSQPDGRVELTATLAAGNLVVAVADEGPGMPPLVAEFLARSFPVPPPLRPDIGLGVWTVRNLVSRCGGAIAVGAGDSGGVRIEVRLPVGNREGRLHAVA